MQKLQNFKRNKMNKFRCSALALALLATSPSIAQNTKVLTISQSVSDSLQATNYLFEDYVTKQEIVWGMDWLPNGSFLFTERKGAVKMLENGKVVKLKGFPKDIAKGNQAGVFDLLVQKNGMENPWIYVSYAAKTTPHTSLKIVRFKLKKHRIENLETIVQTSPSNKWRGHYGTRMQFDKDGCLYVGIGEGGPTSRGGVESPNQNAQNTSELWGKVLRVKENGSIPEDNPILPDQTEPTAVYSYGHRNPQGLIITANGMILEAEHGPKGGDEINIIEKGANYGWPHVSYGVNYDNVIISEKPTKEGFKDPIHYYLPSIGTCGMVQLKGSLFKEWENVILIGGLASKNISKVTLSDNLSINEETIFKGLGRIRNIKQGPDGAIYVSLENPGRVLRISPK
jgi:aldose sugar dehydrogenase